MKVWRRQVIGATALVLLAAGLVFALPPAAVPAQTAGAGPKNWSDIEKAVLRSLSIDSLPPLPADPSNRVTDNPRAARLGQRLFFDTRLSADNQVSCATCHLPELAFTDGRKFGRGVGTAGRNTPTILGSAYSPWLFWDGRKDSLWSQALGPTESAVEHGGTRTQFAHIVATDPTYRSFYRVVFGPLPDLSDSARFPAAAGPVDDAKARAAWDGMMAADRAAVSAMFANIGKAIAAYERRLIPGPSRFDRYVAAVLDGDDAGARAIFSDDEAAGLRLFIGRGQCTRCHNGPLFSNFTFHNTGVPPWPGTQPDKGRSIGVTQALEDPFNCLGDFSDAGASDCGELKFAKTAGADLVGAMKTPSLRNISKTAPYMHAGQYAILDPVLDHYNRAPKAAIGTSELSPLDLTPADLAALKSFLLTLDSPPVLERADLMPLN